MKNVGIVGSYTVLILLSCLTILVATGIDTVKNHNFLLQVGTFGLLVAGFSVFFFGAMLKSGSLAEPDDVLKTFGVYEVLGSVEASAFEE